jgi:sugar-specific transcriptional regulator TrmB
MDQIAEQLKKLGLGDYEALIYATLLSSSPASATFIAKKCNLSRSSVYTTLHALSAKGLVGTTYKNDVKQFIAQDHSTLELLLKKERSDLDEKFNTLKLLQENLKDQVNTNVLVPQIIFFEGQEGLKKIYLSMMRQAKEKSTLYLLRDEFVWQPEWKFIFQEEWHSRVKKLKIEKDIHTKLLINDSKIEKDHKMFYTLKKDLSFGFLPSKNSVQQFAVYILGDVISILSIEKNNLVGIKITNQHLSKNFQSVFDTIWQKRRKA